ncbi:MAG: bifunctional UDP-sugar hydrolase/5'-nucleotidase [Syntrophomonadaceae bacterium]|nr:bifunctional UDP-sugar hydrolase/5'-nucleotidase [Syntrophomonadaceae bacterium]
MTRLSKGLGLLLILVLLIAGSNYSQAAESSVTILFTHDLHDNLLPYKVEENGKLESRGGFARLQTVINLQREKDPDLLLLDGGDFSMGTLFQTIFDQEAAALRLTGEMGYDTVTLGNHEFDYRPQGLADCLTAARASKEELPFIVAGNISYPVDFEGRITGKDLKQLQQSLYEYGAGPYTVLECKGYLIGVFGIMGQDAASNAPMSGVTFTDPVEQAGLIVDKLHQQEKVDMIICLSHSGTVSEEDESEDVILAQKVPEIDVIISGHSHSKLNQPIKIGNTYICSAGEYGQNLGKITLIQQGNSAWRQLEYQLIPINDRVSADSAIEKRIDKFKSIVQKTYLDGMGMTFDGILAHSSFSFMPISQMTEQHAEQPLGNLISDAFIYAVRQAEGANYQPVDVAIVPNGTIRASLVKGDITVSDAFNVSSLGTGPDNKSGYPLISVYLTGKELKTACEVDASITPLMNAAQLYMSGLTYTFNPNRLMFNKVTDVALLRSDGTREEIDDAKLYRLVAGLYSAQMLSVVGDKSFGLLSIIPKNREGIAITDFEAEIIRDGENNELKEWLALAEYLQSFDQINGVPQIPSYYNQKQARKIVDNETTVRAFLAKPNVISLTVYGIIILIVLLVILSIRFLVKRRQIIKQKHTYDRMSR